MKNTFNTETVLQILRSVERVKTGFPTLKTHQQIMIQLGHHELKERVHLIAGTIDGYLNQSQKIMILTQAAQDLEGFLVWPLLQILENDVSKINKRELNATLNALKKMTARFTSEFAVRPYLEKYYPETLQFLIKCTQDSNDHIRRWASEGTRLRLPWGASVSHLKKDYQNIVLLILEPLKWDDSLYVRKSVANHLNDITKIDPNFVIKLLIRWKSEAKSEIKKDSEKYKKINWIILRALRNEIKSGNPKAINLIGLKSDDSVSLQSFKVSPIHLPWSGTLFFECNLFNQSTKNKKIRIDYVICFNRQNQTQGRKVFVGKTIQLVPNEKFLFQSKYTFKTMTTRKYYPGLHQIEIQVNGVVLGSKQFQLLEA